MEISSSREREMSEDRRCNLYHNRKMMQLWWEEKKRKKSSDWILIRLWGLAATRHDPDPIDISVFLFFFSLHHLSVFHRAERVSWVVVDSGHDVTLLSAFFFFSFRDSLLISFRFSIVSSVRRVVSVFWRNAGIFRFGVFVHLLPTINWTRPRMRLAAHREFQGIRQIRKLHSNSRQSYADVSRSRQWQ